jgi:hypothetical protein
LLPSLNSTFINGREKSSWIYKWRPILYDCPNRQLRRLMLKEKPEGVYPRVLFQLRFNVIIRIYFYCA